MSASDQDAADRLSVAEREWLEATPLGERRSLTFTCGELACEYGVDRSDDDAAAVCSVASSVQDANSDVVVTRRLRSRGTTNAVWTSVDFPGPWPVSVAAIAVAPDEVTARRLIAEAQGCKPDELTVQPLDVTVEHAVVLCNGDY